MVWGRDKIMLIGLGAVSSPLVRLRVVLPWVLALALGLGSLWYGFSLGCVCSPCSLLPTRLGWVLVSWFVVCGSLCSGLRFSSLWGGVLFCGYWLSGEGCAVPVCFPLGSLYWVWCGDGHGRGSECLLGLDGSPLPVIGGV